MDNQNQNPVTPQNDLPVSEIVSALKSAPPVPTAPVSPVAPPASSPLQEITPPSAPITPVVPPVIPAGNPLVEDPDQVISPGSK